MSRKQMIKGKTKYLEAINSPDDLKKLEPDELYALAAEIRRFLLNSIAQSGGHLASNLGVVELTIALHYCHNLPNDKIVWDVGHQAYVHKILTGRKDRFYTLRKFGGLSGFPKPDESDFDAFATGHSSTSISAAFGLASARDMNGENFSVTAVIGDGSMTGGLAYEALNNAGQSDTNLLVVLNDNQMSISENVGSVSRHLNSMRSAPFYIGAKRGIQSFTYKIPLIGKPLARFMEKTKDIFRHLFVNGVLFEELGFKYIGPVDGHDLLELIKVIDRCKNISGPVLLHVYTQKGKGYAAAEQLPEKYHGVDSFNLRMGINDDENNADDGTYSNIFGNKLVSLAEADRSIIAVTASMSKGTGLSLFSEKFPDRLFDVGIAEAHAVTFCAGLAMGGLKPVFAVYSSFLQRAYDQILHDVCLQNLPVVFAVDRAGIVGADGDTHQGIFDLSFLSQMPNMTVLAPKDGRELEEMLDYALNLGSPVAIRYPKKANIEQNCVSNVTSGGEIAVISVGVMFDTACDVCESLMKKGYKTTVFNAKFVKPIEETLISELADYKYIFTIEDNIEIGGFGQNLFAILNRHIDLSEKVMRCFAFPDKFIEHGTRGELLAKYELDSDGILKRIYEVLSDNETS